jgi:hypothetical protein
MEKSEKAEVHYGYSGTKPIVISVTVGLLVSLVYIVYKSTEPDWMSTLRSGVYENIENQGPITSQDNDQEIKEIKYIPQNTLEHSFLALAEELGASISTTSMGVIWRTSDSYNISIQRDFNIVDMGEQGTYREYEPNGVTLSCVSDEVQDYTADNNSCANVLVDDMRFIIEKNGFALAEEYTIRTGPLSGALPTYAYSNESSLCNLIFMPPEDTFVGTINFVCENRVRYDSSYNLQYPLLSDIVEPNSSLYISEVKYSPEMDHAVISTNANPSGYFLQKQDGNWKVLSAGREPPSCDFYKIYPTFAEYFSSECYEYPLPQDWSKKYDDFKFEI